MGQDPFRDLPTPPPLEPVLPEEQGRSLLERLAVQRKLLAVLVGIGLVLAVAGVLLLLRGGRGPEEPTVEMPPSLAELAQEYPQLAGLFNDATLGSVYKEFMVAYHEGGIDAARDLAGRRGMLNAREEIRITLVLDDAGYVPAVSEEMRRVGITVEGSYRERINVGVPLALIEGLAAQQGTAALFQQLTQMEHIIRLELPAPRRSDALPAGAAGGEGTALTGAGEWHAAGLTGKGIRVGILDLGFDGYRDLLGSELPASVVAASFAYGLEPDGSGEVHGTACAEIVHEMAPDAELYLAFYDGTLVSMGQAVDWLLAQGVHIISNSTTGVVGPMDGSDESAGMVDRAAGQGVLWVNSSGNAALEHYRGLFADEDGDGIHEFPDGTEIIGLYVYGPQVTLALNWDDWQAVSEDYDLYLFDQEGNLVASAEDIQNGLVGQEAAELILGNDVSEGLYYVSIRADQVTRPGMLDLYTLGAELEFPVAEHSLGSPADAQGALAVGATEARDDSLAAYSSQGPSNDGRLKPELSAPAGVSSASYAPDVFDGTSASTPHVAGAAALVWSAFAEYSGQQVRDYLQFHALDLGPAGPDNAYGYGRLSLPAPPLAAAGPAALPTPLPTLPAEPTSVPQATVVAALPGGEPGSGAAARRTEEVGLRVSLPLALGGLGLCGGLLLLAGGGLLLVAASRSYGAQQVTAAPPAMAHGQRPPAGAAPAPVASGQGYGALLVPGRPPLQLSSGQLTIGRAAGNDLVVDSLLVSRTHARLDCGSGQCAVYDLGSANGTFVNGRRVSRASLSVGDVLRLGDVELVYQGGALPGSRAWLEQGSQRHDLLPAGTTLGRSRDSDVVIADERASRQHAIIELRAIPQGQEWVISDLSSANGTFVNGERVRARVLRRGDEICIGDTRLRFGAP
jgi:pSer/pThr/pTyr-binding forkhead associated (FHA) protein/subtilisin family serine protease